MRHLVLFGGWLFTTFGTLLFAFIFLGEIAFPPGLFSLLRFQAEYFYKSPYPLFSSLPQVAADVKMAIKYNDARPIILKEFFRLYRSPLEPYAQFIVEISDKYGIDYRLIPAIAMAESGGGRNIPPNSYNAWGWGIYGDKVVRFQSWEEGIERVAKSLREDYINQGLDTPEEIMPKWAPPSVKKGGPWAKAVSYFLNQMR